MSSPLERLRRRIEELREESLATATLLTRADALVRRALPASAAVWATVDPATALFTTCQRFGLDDVPDRERLVIENELDGEDVNLFSSLARGARHAGSLALATGQRLEQSPRYLALQPDLPLIDELRIALVSRGSLWGTGTLYRRPGEPVFTEADVAFGDSVASVLGEALRLSMVRALAQEAPTEETAPGVLVLGPGGEIVSATAAAARLLARLRPDGGIPPSVTAVALGGLRHDGRRAHARVPDHQGRWIELHGSALDAERAAVVLEEAQAPALADVIVQACGLTAREREVTELVLRGAATRDISEQLFISEYTVQDHLKSVFEKTGVRSRRELAAFLGDRYYRIPRSRGALPGPYGWFVPGVDAAR